MMRIRYLVVVAVMTGNAMANKDIIRSMFPGNLPYEERVHEDHLTKEEIAALGMKLPGPAEDKGDIKTYLLRADAKASAVMSIGRLGLQDWIPYLIENIGVISNIRLHSSPMAPAEDHYPCAGALIRIGEPSVEPVLAALANPKDQDQRELLHFTLKKLCGEERAALLIREKSINLSKPLESRSRPTKRGEPQGKEGTKFGSPPRSAGGVADKRVSLKNSILWLTGLLAACGAVFAIWRMKRAAI